MKRTGIIDRLKRAMKNCKYALIEYFSNPHVFGRIAEYKTMVSFIFKGYVPLKNRYKCKYGEIDLILKRGNTLAFVEVKARSHYLEGEFCDIVGSVVSSKQLHRIQNAAMQYVQTHYSQKQPDITINIAIVKNIFGKVHLFENVTM